MTTYIHTYMYITVPVHTYITNKFIHTHISYIHTVHTYIHTYILYCILYHNNILLYLYQYTTCVLLLYRYVMYVLLQYLYSTTVLSTERKCVCISMNIFHTTVFTRWNVISTIDYRSAQMITVHAGIDYNTCMIYIEYILY